MAEEAMLVEASPIMEVVASPIMEPNNETPSTPEKKELVAVHPCIPHGGFKKLSPKNWKHLFNRLKPSNAPKDSKGEPFTHQCTLDGKCLRLPYCQKKNCYFALILPQFHESEKNDKSILPRVGYGS